MKLAAEVDVGLLTQCIKERTFGRMNPATAGNILLKINAKLNGINHSVDRNRWYVVRKNFVGINCGFFVHHKLCLSIISNILMALIISLSPTTCFVPPPSRGYS